VDYDEYPVRPELRSIVRCYWHLRGPSGSGPPERVIPDGCAEIVLNRAERFRRIAPDLSSHLQANVLLVGQLPSAISIAPQGAVDLLGIRFQPAGLHALLGVPMHELTNVDVALNQVAPKLGRDLFEACHEPSIGRRLQAVGLHLVRALAGRRATSTHQILAEATRQLETHMGTVAETAATLQIGRRRLERLFRQHVGLSPRRYLRIRRLQGVVSKLEGGAPTPSWAQLAVDAGYYDQSHLIRDFRSIGGTTPQRYLAEQNTMAAAFASSLSHPSNP
jgi:AraC-like DNA-binding protein